MPEPGDQTEAELEKTRRVVAASMAEQIATNDAAAREGVEEEVSEPASGSLEDMTKAELLELATEREVEGRYAMNKAELLEALEGNN